MTAVQPDMDHNKMDRQIGRLGRQRENQGEAERQTG